jgi:RNA polymerase sigma factor (sigma-70 family)
VSATPSVTHRLEDVRPDLLAFLRRHGGWVLRLETAEDLMQGLHLRVLERGSEARFEDRKAFLKWIYAVARTYVADRKVYWSALKRDSARLVRLTTAGAGFEQVAAITGPSTFASRRELAAIAIRTLAVLRPRDRRLVRWTAEGVPLEEQAIRLGLSYTAARQARARAVERFRKAFELARRSES